MLVSALVVKVAVHLDRVFTELPYAGDSQFVNVPVPSFNSSAVLIPIISCFVLGMLLVFY